MVPPRLEPSKLSHPSRRGINAKLSPSSRIRAQTGIGLEGHGARPGGVGFLWRCSFRTKENENCSWTTLATPATPSHIFVLPSSPLQFGQAEDKEKHSTPTPSSPHIRPPTPGLLKPRGKEVVPCLIRLVHSAGRGGSPAPSILHSSRFHP